MIRIESLRKTYGRVVALHEIDLTVPRGEFFGLLGPNGAGKSTLLKAIVGLLHPTRGTVRIDGIDLFRDRRTALRRIGYVPQRIGFPAHQTVREVLAFHAALKGLVGEAVDRAVQRVGLQEDSHRCAGELSGGMMQRLGLAQALLAEPPVLVLDEPTVGLDPHIAADFRQILWDLNEAGTTIVLSSHLLGEVERIARRVAILKEGRIVAEDSISGLLIKSGLCSALWVKPVEDLSYVQNLLHTVGIPAETVGESLRIVSHNGDFLRALEALRRTGVTIESFWTTSPTLDEVFRLLVGKRA